jgi:hypothetical protein
MDADNVTFQASDPEAKPTHLFCMGLEFIRLDIYKAALEEIEHLKAELDYHLWQRGLKPKPPVEQEG